METFRGIHLRQFANVENGKDSIERTGRDQASCCRILESLDQRCTNTQLNLRTQVLTSTEVSTDDDNTEGSGED